MASRTSGPSERQVQNPASPSSRGTDTVLTTPPRSPLVFSCEKLDVRKRVLRALISYGSTAANLAHEVLELGVIAGTLTPVPMLGQGAELLLALYEGAIDTKLIEFNYMGLVSRAADMIFKMTQEVHNGGNAMVQELSEPLGHLENDLNKILNSMERTRGLSWLQRYLNRREIEREIMALDKGLTDTMDQFGRIVQLRVFRRVEEVAETLRRWEKPTMPQQNVQGHNQPLLQSACGQS